MSSHLKPPVDNKDHIQGNPKAEIEIVEYGDYQCPHCGAAYPVLKKLQEKFTTQIRFVFRNFPLSDAHPMALPAAIASEAAALQGKYWEMHDMIFEHQRSLSPELLHLLAKNIGLDTKQFAHDIQNEELEQKVDADFESGIRSGVNGTPSFFVNGAKFNGGAEDLFDMLEQNAG